MVVAESRLAPRRETPYLGQAINAPPTKDTVSVAAPRLAIRASRTSRAGFTETLRSMTASPTWRERPGGVAGSASEAQTATREQERLEIIQERCTRRYQTPGGRPPAGTK